MNSSDFVNTNEGPSSNTLFYQIFLYRTELPYKKQKTLQTAQVKLALTRALIANDHKGKQLCQNQRLLALSLITIKACQIFSYESLKYSKKIKETMKNAFDPWQYDQLMKAKRQKLKTELDIKTKVSKLRKEEACYEERRRKRIEHKRLERKPTGKQFCPVLKYN